jgi:hypothetical protein
MKNRIQRKEFYILRLITLAYLTDKIMRVTDLLKKRFSVWADNPSLYYSLSSEAVCCAKSK